MAKSKIKKIIRFMVEILREKVMNISKIILFGSQIEGKASAESDIDVVVVSKNFRNKDIFERVELIKGAEIMTIKKFVIPLDIITMTPEEFESETSLIAEYAKQGEVVYGV